MAGLKLVLVLLVCAAVAAPHMVDAVTCSTVANGLSGCINYLQKGGAPSPGCCSGVKGLLKSASTTADRQTICNCLKSLSKSASVNPGYASKLPGSCGVSIPYPISTSTNCATIK